MIDFSAAADGFALLFASWGPWGVVIPGLLLGLIGGSIPGISTSMTMAIFLPFTVYMEFLPAILFLSSIFTGGGFGGAIPAILMNIPGTPASVATCFDGYPMARRGDHNEALGIALAASVIGTIIGYAVLVLAVETISSAVLNFGPFEMVFIALWGLTLIAALRGRHMARGLFAGAFGILLGTIGYNSAGYLRGTMGIDVLEDGIPVVPAMIGLFAASQLFSLLGTEYLVEKKEARKISSTRIRKGIRIALSYPTVLIRGSLIGILIGAIPGVGGAIANLLSYSETKRVDEAPETFGTGNPKGVVAAEAANSSSEGGQMATMLALGIPGGGSTAMLLVAFQMHDITGGPRFIDDFKEIVYAVFIANFGQAVLLFVIGFAFVHIASSIVKVPLRILIPTVMSMAVFGAFSVTGNMSGPITLFIFAIFGWFLSRYDYPVTATVIGLILGKMADEEALRSYQLSRGDPFYILERPFALVIAAMLIASLVLPWAIRKYRDRKNEPLQSISD
jgi:putative tricarboxylic transport membrane protein